jgi:hypothetical protein
MKGLLRWATLFYVTAAIVSGAAAQDPLQQIEQEGIERTEQGQVVQKKVDTMHDSTRSLEDEYYAHLKLVEGLRLYNSMLGKQLESQRDEIELLNASISDVAVVSRQILPLMSRMVDALEQFIELDMPFLVAERRQRVEKMRALLVRADVLVAEKVRRVMEAYQVENDYGRTIEAYKDKLQLGDASFDADFLRIGRVGLLYRTVGSDNVGYWDMTEGTWVPLESTPWRRHIEQGLKVARQEIAPELIAIALDPAQQVKQ